MAFWGCTFSFDGISCSQYQLMLYNIGDKEQDATEFANTVKIHEEHIGTQWKPLFFGVSYENKLEGKLTFGVNQDRLDRQEYLTRDELSAVSTWLCGRKTYCPLTIAQDDMVGITYKCMITELKTVERGGFPWGFIATVTCDGPYAYRDAVAYTYHVDGDTTFNIDNVSDHHGDYSPVITITTGTSILTEENDAALTAEDESLLLDGGEFVVENLTTGQVMQFSKLPDTVLEIHVDCEHGVITSNTMLNMYKYFNFQFLRLKRGVNHIRCRGSGTIRFQCEYPVSVGF